jgi:hypothetical protein
MAAAAALRFSIASAEYRPCFQFAFRLRSSPSGVRGPVLLPPWNRQRPFAIAGPSQESPRRVRAPHRGDAFASSKRLNSMRTWGSLAISARPPAAFRWRPPTSFAIDLGRENRLAALRDVHMLHCDDLAAAGANALQGKQARLKTRR